MKTYLIHIQLQKRPDAEIKAFGLAVNKILEQHTQSNLLAYSASTDSKQLIAFAVQSEKSAHVLRVAIDGNQSAVPGRDKKPPIHSGFKNGDQIIVLEIGADISDNGFNALNTWLTRRRD